MLTDTVETGPILKRFVNAAGNRYSAQKTLLGKSDIFELYHFKGQNPLEDPEYCLVTKDGLQEEESAAIRFAMTGEVTLTGKVLPVGGIREKVIAARRAGVKEIILPRDNYKNVNEIPRKTREGLKFHYVNNIDDVLRLSIPS